MELFMKYEFKIRVKWSDSLVIEGWFTVGENLCPKPLSIDSAIRAITLGSCVSGVPLPEWQKLAVATLGQESKWLNAEARKPSPLLRNWEGPRQAGWHSPPTAPRTTCIPVFEIATPLTTMSWKNSTKATSLGAKQSGLGSSSAT